MGPIDVGVIALYLVTMVGIGMWTGRTGAADVTQYVVAGRRLPWWVIGLSDVAGNAGSDAIWVSIFVSAAFIGFYRVWWISWVVALAVGVLWARYWRRLPLLTPNQLFEFRYEGTAAGRFRSFSAIYEAFIVRSLVLGYVLQGLAQALAPLVEWPSDLLLGAVCAVSVLYSLIGGMAAVAFSDVAQFTLIMVGRMALATFVLSAVGGVAPLLGEVESLRGGDFLQPYPPSPGGTAAEYQVDAGSFIALALLGLFRGPVGGEDAQRFLAARNETHAIWGHVFNLVLTLVVRIAPLVIVGLGAVVLLRESSDSLGAWAQVVIRVVPSGWLGIVLVGALAGYMSTIDTFVHASSSTLMNDVLARRGRGAPHGKSLVRAGQWAGLLFMGSAYAWARFLIGRVDADWIVFVNTVIPLFALPAGVLRWVWWRANIWTEISALAGAVPIAYLAWFEFGLKDEPYWFAFFVLIGAGWSVILLATLLTPPVAPDVLLRFYRVVRPPGFWGPVAHVASTGSGPRLSFAARDTAAVVGCLATGAGLVSGVASAFASQLVPAAAGTALAIGGAVIATRALADRTPDPQDP